MDKDCHGNDDRFLPRLHAAFFATTIGSQSRMDLDNDRLDSWKEIAAYLGKSVRTVRRWEQAEGMPVHRHLHDKQGSVYAHRSELEAWRKRHSSLETTSARTVRSRMWLRVAAGTVIAFGTGAALVFFLALPKQREAQVNLLTTYAGRELQPSLSPDGTQVAFAWDEDREANFDIFVKLVGAGTALRLTSDPANDFSPAWSPDGQWIAFIRCAPGRGSAIMMLPALGGSEQKLAETNFCFSAVGPTGATEAPTGTGLAWSADSRSLVFLGRESPSEPVSLFVLSVRSGEKRRLTTPGSFPAADVHPAMSPHGSTLAFIRYMPDQTGGLFVLSLSEGLEPEGIPKQLTFGRSEVLSPAWTPDGRQIIFSDYVGHGRSLWRIDAAGSKSPKRVLQEHVTSLSIAHRAGRTGVRLACARQFLDDNIWRIELSGPSKAASPPVKFISSTRRDASPHLAPDGKVVFASDRSGPFELWISASDGHQAVPLTSFGDAPVGPPAWCPDGKRVAFSYAVDGQRDLYTMEVDGGPPIRLTSTAAIDDAPSWSTDGRSIYFGSNQGGTFQIWKIAVEGGQPVQITRSGGRYGVESPDGKFLYYTDVMSPTPVWKLDLTSGVTTKVIDATNRWPNLAVVDNGIYFARGNPVRPGSVEFFQFSTGQVHLIASTSRAPYAGLTVSRDRRSLLYTQIDQQGSDLLLIDRLP
jgi:Tol biopolymer transport system component